MYLIFQLIVSLNTFLFEPIVCNIVTVGNYSQLNPKTCGLSRHSIGVDTNCFKWHKDILSPMRGAKNVTLGDAPWVVYINYQRPNFNGRCTGSIIADQWILTAAHCMRGSFNIKIHLGYKLSINTITPSEQPFDVTNTTYIHPEYVRPIYDMALVRMNKPINTSERPLLANSICLPEKWAGLNDCSYRPTPNCERVHYGMASGWGTGKHPALNNLQIGYWRLYNQRHNLSTNPNVYNRTRSDMVMNPLDNQTICTGDSGGPVWQYVMGRAVIVGVISGVSFDDMDCETNNYSYNSFSAYVDQEIDWIMKITRLN